MARKTRFASIRLFNRRSRRWKSPSSRRQPLGRHALMAEALEDRIVLSANPVLTVVDDQMVAEGTELSLVDIGAFTDAVEGGGSSIGLNPVDFVSLGSFDPASDVVIDSTTLSMTGGFSAAGVMKITDSGVEIAVFTFADFELDAGISITSSGSRPIALLSRSGVSISGTIDVSGTRTNRGDSEPGPGGGAGGEQADGSPFDGFGAFGAPADSVGRMNTNTSQGGGGGGACGGDGGTGGGFGLTGAGGDAYGDLSVVIQGGSGGGGARAFSPNKLPSGGGGVEIGAVGSLTIESSGSVDASGVHGGNGSSGLNGGGGAGGGILLHAFNVKWAGTLEADGGDGGPTRQRGGGGGGGRILIAHDANGMYAQEIDGVTGTHSELGGDQVFASGT